MKIFESILLVALVLMGSIPTLSLMGFKFFDDMFEKYTKLFTITLFIITVCVLVPISLFS